MNFNIFFCLKIEYNSNIVKFDMSYNPGLELVPFGFDNMGATCYFNSVLQSLLSCTSFIDEIIKNKERKKYNEHPVLSIIIEMVELGLSFRNDIDKKREYKIRDTREISEYNQKLSNYSPRIWVAMIKLLCKKHNKRSREFMAGQQCAGEGFNYLLDSMDEFTDIQNLFLHRYCNSVQCFNCGKWISKVTSMNNIFAIPHNLESEQIKKFKHNNTPDMSQFLAKQTGYVEDYICPKCKDNAEKYTVNNLTMVPEILVVLSKKYKCDEKLDVYTDFSKTLEFNGKNGKKMIYDAVSQIEHVGNLNGGHYWAISRRYNGWYKLNDESVGDSEFKPTNNTYIVFYHLR